MRNKIKKIVAVLLCVLLVGGTLVGCDEASRVNENITQEAQNFNVYRRITVINCLKGDVLFSMEGRMNIEADVADNQLEIVVELEDEKTKKIYYKKHFIGLSDNVTYTVEDISGSEVSKYHYSINYNPNMWIPFDLKNID